MASVTSYSHSQVNRQSATGISPTTAIHTYQPQTICGSLCDKLVQFFLKIRMHIKGVIELSPLPSSFLQRDIVAIKAFMEILQAYPNTRNQVIPAFQELSARVHSFFFVISNQRLHKFVNSQNAYTSLPICAQFIRECNNLLSMYQLFYRIKSRSEHTANPSPSITPSIRDQDPFANRIALTTMSTEEEPEGIAFATKGAIHKRRDLVIKAMREFVDENVQVRENPNDITSPLRSLNEQIQCPISCVPMSLPVYHEEERGIHYLDASNLLKALSRKSECPICRVQLTQGQLKLGVKFQKEIVSQLALAISQMTDSQIEEKLNKIISDFLNENTTSSINRLSLDQAKYKLAFEIVRNLPDDPQLNVNNQTQSTYERVKTIYVNKIVPKTQFVPATSG